MIVGYSVARVVFAKKTVILDQCITAFQLRAVFCTEPPGLVHMAQHFHMDQPGRLNAENRAQLENCNALIQDERLFREDDPRDTVTNYHVAKILTLRQDLLHALEK